MANNGSEANSMPPIEHTTTSAQEGPSSPVGVAKTTDSAVETASTIAPTEASSQDGAAANPPPIPPSSWFNASRRPRTAPGPRQSSLRNRRLLSDAEGRRDSGLAPPAVPSRTSSREENGLLSPTSSAPQVASPQDKKSKKLRRKASNGRPRTAKARVEGSSEGPSMEPFVPLTMSIPTVSFDDLTTPGMLSFSKRGSVLLGGRRANDTRQRIEGRTDMRPSREFLTRLHVEGTVESDPEAAQEVGTPGTRRHLASPRGQVMSADDADLSKKVRSLYDTHGADFVDPNEAPPIPIRSSSLREHTTGPLNPPTEPLPSTELLTAEDPRPTAELTMVKSQSSARDVHEVAGGIEDWEDVEGQDVDRYGFIIPKRESYVGSPPPAPGIQRTSTLLQIASETPRRARSVRRMMSTNRSTHSVNTPNSLRRKPSFRSARPPTSIRSSRTSFSTASRGPIRYVSNRMPHNKQRKLLDEAGDMLTLPPGLAAIEEEKEGGRGVMMMKKKEWTREDKWRKMGKTLARPKNGRGMIFEFNIKDPKLISRTWKGIPDKWRGAAWHAFLSASAKKTENTLSDEELIEQFNVLQLEDCAEDMQIDVDVPRTISQHVMFRRRYRGGQRLLFRVLHALTLHFPNVGYVQGMASLAATLLCYYDEENAFVMMVRMWDHRGLRQLYAHGFEGLMTALSDFEKNWLGEGEVGKKLMELGIHPTTYGAKWYLTLFHHVLPFPAQLRIWDVYMLLGDVPKAPGSNEDAFNGELDVLHAASAALFDAMREILLDADFETSMNMLTHSIPIKDEDLLMRVAKAEWRRRKRKGKAA